MTITLIIAKLCALFLRLTKRGATTLPGKVALRLKPDIIRRLSKGVKIICVTGTNGKTTTCALISHLMKCAGKEYFTNGSGANMQSGVATAFIMNSSLRGKRKKEYAVLECDENSFPLIASYVDAAAVVVTNVFRDQLDRYGETSKTLSKIREGIEKMPEALIILNADDPLTFSLCKTVKNAVCTFGINYNSAKSGISDSLYCPVCRAKLNYKSKTLSQLGNFTCPRCSFRRITPDYEISEISETGFILGGELYSTPLSGLYNLYNFCAAAAVSGELKIGETRSLCSFSGAFGRMEKFETNGKTVLLLLVKNPAGLTACISYVCRIKGPLCAAFALNDNAADGRDVSWIWDADFTPVKEKCRSVYAIGTRAYDMALRLKYDGVSCEKIIDGEEYKKLIELIKNCESDFIVFANYTAMMNMRKTFISAFGGKEFWE